MKKIVAYASVAVFVFSASCSSNTKEDNTDSASHSVRDTQAILECRNDSVNRNSTSSDLSLFFLKGKVQEVIYNGDNTFVPQLVGMELQDFIIKFDENGQLIFPQEFSVIRSDDQIVEIKKITGNEKSSWKYAFDDIFLKVEEYDLPQEAGTLSFSYDRYGGLKGTTDKSYSEGSMLIIRSSISEVEKDSVGNWVKLKVQQEITEYNELGQIQNMNTRDYTSSRTIHYYF